MAGQTTSIKEKERSRITTAFKRRLWFRITLLMLFLYVVMAGVIIAEAAYSAKPIQAILEAMVGWTALMLVLWTVAATVTFRGHLEWYMSRTPQKYLSRSPLFDFVVPAIVVPLGVWLIVKFFPSPLACAASMLAVPLALGRVYWIRRLNFLLRRLIMLVTSSAMPAIAAVWNFQSLTFGLKTGFFVLVAIGVMLLLGDLKGFGSGGDGGGDAGG